MLSGPRRSWFKSPSFRLEWTLETPSSYSLYLWQSCFVWWSVPARPRQEGADIAVPQVWQLCLVWNQAWRPCCIRSFTVLHFWSSLVPAELQTGSSSRVPGELAFLELPSRPHSGTQEGGGREGPALTSWGLSFHGIAAWAACLANT